MHYDALARCAGSPSSGRTPGGQAALQLLCGQRQLPVFGCQNVQLICLPAVQLGHCVAQQIAHGLAPSAAYLILPPAVVLRSFIGLQSTMVSIDVAACDAARVDCQTGDLLRQELHTD